MVLDSTITCDCLEILLRVVGGGPPRDWNALRLRVSAPLSLAAFAGLVKEAVCTQQEDRECWWCCSYHL
jgi:hypothetical protein